MKAVVKYYLGAYNFVAFVFWAAYLVCFIAGGLGLNAQSLWLLNIAQGLAILEVLHALLKWVKSPVLSTLAQVASRLLVVVLINVLISTLCFSKLAYAGVIIVSFAWGITELVRYSLYFLGLFNMQPARLLWIRYSFFIALYPIGVTGEWCIFLAPVIAGGSLVPPQGFPFPVLGYRIFILVMLISYVYYFPVLYRYMWKQRKTKLT